MMKYNKTFLLSSITMAIFLTGCVSQSELKVDKPVDKPKGFIDSKSKNIEDKNNKKDLKKDNEEDLNSNDKDIFKEDVDSLEDINIVDSSFHGMPLSSISSNCSVDNNLDKDKIVLEKNPVFKKSEITNSIKVRMDGRSMKENSSISYDDLSYLIVTHLDYNGNTTQGEMVVHKKLADEVLEIFKEIYYAKFPIERMRLIDDYDAIDHASMINNNSSAFCYRTVSGTDKVSNHGLGIAIDINPFYNPHVSKDGKSVNPSEASKYTDRSLDVKGMIKKNDVVYKAFTSRGWTWGGNWNNPDYQHFEKKI